MAHALVEHGVDVIVGKRVEDVAAVAAELDQVRLLKRAQLVRHRRLRGCGRFGDVAVNMMKAWYIATALAKQYDAVLPILQERLMDSWSHNKAIQKARESYRITPQQKEYLSTLKV